MAGSRVYPGNKFISGDDPLGNYLFVDQASGADGTYYGFVDIHENWVIMKKTSSSGRYFKGSGDYATNWGNRESFTYYYPFQLRW